LVSIFFWYTTVVKVAMSAVTCVPVCDSAYWIVDVEHACPWGKAAIGKPERMWALLVGIPAWVLAVGMTLLVVALLVTAAVRRSHSESGERLLDSKGFAAYFSFMYSDYRYQFEPYPAGNAPGSRAGGSVPVIEHVQQGNGIRPSLPALEGAVEAPELMQARWAPDVEEVTEPTAAPAAAAAPEVRNSLAQELREYRQRLFQFLFKVGWHIKHGLPLVWDAVIHLPSPAVDR